MIGIIKHAGEGEGEETVFSAKEAGLWLLPKQFSDSLCAALAHIFGASGPTILCHDPPQYYSFSQAKRGCFVMSSYHTFIHVTCMLR